MNIGTDIVQISRIEKALNKFGNKFSERFLHPSEIDIAKRTDSIAGFWAAKEAVSKALGCGIGKNLSFHDIIISKNIQGSPSFTLSIDAQEHFSISNSSLSISHDAGVAIAVVALQLN
jgi:holo-[acyl-carrier protein] synthase